MTARFILTEAAITERNIKPVMLGRIPDIAQYEELNLSIKFIGSGDTSKISSGQIIETIFNLISEIKDHDTNKIN